MSVTLLVEQELKAVFDAKAATTKTEVGLLIGTLRPQLEIRDCVPTPEDREEGASSEIEAVREALLDHGLLTNCILPGGMAIVGVYFCCEQSQRSTMLSAVKKCMKTFYEDRQITSAEDVKRVIMDFTSGNNQPSAILIRTDSRRSTSSAECNLQFHQLKALIPIHCSYALDLSIPISCQKLDQKSVRDEILQTETKRLEELIPVSAKQHDLIADQRLEELMDGESVRVELWEPIGIKRRIEEQIVRGRFAINGVMDCRAMCPIDSSAQEAVAAIKMDALYSIKARFEVIRDDEEEQENTMLDSTTILPRRVWCRWKKGVEICDYVFENGSLDDVRQSIEDLLHFRVDQIDDKERMSMNRSAEKNWDPLENRDLLKAKKTDGFSSMYLKHIIVGVLAVLLALVSAFFYSNNF